MPLDSISFHDSLLVIQVGIVYSRQCIFLENTPIFTFCSYQLSFFYSFEHNASDSKNYKYKYFIVNI